MLDATRLMKQYYSDLKEQEELRLKIRGMIDEQNNYARRVEIKKP